MVRICNVMRCYCWYCDHSDSQPLIQSPVLFAISPKGMRNLKQQRMSRELSSPNTARSGGTHHMTGLRQGITFTTYLTRYFTPTTSLSGPVLSQQHALNCGGRTRKNEVCSLFRRLYFQTPTLTQMKRLRLLHGIERVAAAQPNATATTS